MHIFHLLGDKIIIWASTKGRREKDNMLQTFTCWVMHHNTFILTWTAFNVKPPQPSKPSETKWTLSTIMMHQESLRGSPDSSLLTLLSGLVFDGIYNGSDFWLRTYQLWPRQTQIRTCKLATFKDCFYSTVLLPWFQRVLPAALMLNRPYQVLILTGHRMRKHV